jgi:hypothetical protein
MSGIALEGDWSPFPDLMPKVEEALSKGTDEVGMEIIATFKKHFYNQDLGWPALKESTIKKRSKSNIASLKKVKTGELRLRASRFGIDTTGMGKKDIVTSLSGKMQVLIDTGLLAKSFTFKKLSSVSGQVGVKRADGAGNNIAAIHEYGAPSKNIPPRPFVKPVGLEMEPKLAEIYNKFVQSVTIK